LEVLEDFDFEAADYFAATVQDPSPERLAEIQLKLLGLLAR